MKNILTLTAILFITVTSTAQNKVQLKTTKGKVNSNGITIAYESIGNENNETILLIAGLGSQLTDWPVELCNKLALKGYRVIRFDNRDVGLSSKLDTLGAPDWAAIIPKIKTCDTSGLQYTINDMARDAIGLLDGLHIKKAHIVGVSMGGAIAQMIAIYFPERTLSLTSISASTGDPSLPAADAKVLGSISAPPPATENIELRTHYLYNIYKAMDSKTYPTQDTVLMDIARKNVERSWHPAGTERQTAAIVIADNCDRRELLKKIHVPVVIIHGEDDPIVNVQAAREMKETIPGAKLIIIPGMSHAFSPALIDKIVAGILIAVTASS